MKRIPTQRPAAPAAKAPTKTVAKPANGTATKTAPAKPAPKPAAKPAPTKPAPAKKPAPAPVEAEIIEETEAEHDEQTSLAKAGSNGDLPSFAGLMELGDYTPGSIPLPEPRGFPWIGFTHENSSRVRDVLDVIGDVGDGHPYLSAHGTYFSLVQASFVVLAEIRYWAVTDQDNDLVQAWLEEQPFGTKVLVKGKKESVKSCVMCILLILPGSEPLHDQLQPAQVAVCDFRGTKSPFVLDLIRGIEESMTPEWAEQNGQLAGAVPPRFRVTVSFNLKDRTGRGGFAYTEARGDVAPATLTQLEAAAKWHENEEAQAEFAVAQETYDQRVADLVRFCTGEEAETEEAAAE